MERKLSSGFTHVNRPLVIVGLLAICTFFAVVYGTGGFDQSPLFFTVLLGVLGLGVLRSSQVAWSFQHLTANDDGLLVGSERTFVPFSSVKRLRKTWWRPAHYVLELKDPGLLGGRIRFMGTGLPGFSLVFESEDIRWLQERIAQAHDNRAT